MKKQILIANDDGWQAQGIKALSRIASEYGQVTVVAPSRGRSGAACSITPAMPVTIEKITPRQASEEGYGNDVTIYSCSGTPIDSVKIALEKILPHPPDLALSGINHGDNASISLFYSGTVGAVVEASLKGIPSIAFSLRTHNSQCDFTPYGQVIRHWIRKTLHQGLPQGTFLNINFPEVKELKGTSICRMAKGIWHTEWVEAAPPARQADKQDTQAYTLAGTFVNTEPESQDTDYWALDHDMASVTPLKLDMTDYAILPHCR